MSPCVDDKYGPIFQTDTFRKGAFLHIVDSNVADVRNDQRSRGSFRLFLTPNVRGKRSLHPSLTCVRDI